MMQHKAIDPMTDWEESKLASCAVEYKDGIGQMRMKQFGVTDKFSDFDQHLR